MTLDPTKMITFAGQNVPGPVAATLGEAWAALVGDRVTAYRLKNAAALQVKLNEEVGKLGLKLDPSKIPERYALAWFEEATKQDEPEIQELFARLLARAAAGDERATDRRLLEALTHFTPMDAKVFLCAFGRLFDYKYGAWTGDSLEEGLRREIEGDSSLSVEHLFALGIIHRRYLLEADHSEAAPEGALSLNVEIEPTILGRMLYFALGGVWGRDDY